MSDTLKDYTTRTSHMYDDRDGDTLSTLKTPIIKVCDNETPNMVFFLIPKINEMTTLVDIEVVGYVSMMSLSKELQTLVREELKAKKTAEKP